MNCVVAADMLCFVYQFSLVIRILYSFLLRLTLFLKISFRGNGEGGGGDKKSGRKLQHVVFECP